MQAAQPTNTMSKENINAPTDPSSPGAGAKRSQQPYPVGQEDLEKQQQRLSKAAAAGAGVLQTSASPSAPAKSPATSPEKTLGAQAASKLAATPSPAKRPQLPAAQQETAVASAPPKPAPVQAPPPSGSPRPTAAALPKKGSAQAQGQPATKKVTVSFAFVKPGAKAVSLCGEFNGWSPTAMPMKSREDGRWEATLALTPGHYEYKFLVDGEWIPDPAAQKNVANQFGSLNSVLEVRA